MKKHFILFLFCSIFITISAQNIKRPESYNYNRGVEAVQNEKTEESLGVSE